MDEHPDERPADETAVDGHAAGIAQEVTGPEGTTDLSQLLQGSRRPGGFQFSVAELMLMVLVVSLLLGLLALLPPAHAAVLAGVGVMAGLLVIAWLQTSRAVVVIIWWGLVLIYLLFSAMALLRPHG